jgi:glutamine cyclotransferase
LNSVSRTAYLLALTWLMVAVAGQAVPPVAQSHAPVASVRVVRSFPHDTQAFTEGLFYRQGSLYESTGLEGRSSIRRVELVTGKVIQQRSLDARYFGEGIVASGDKLFQLTWKGQVGFIYGLSTFARLGEFNYKGEGWGLTRTDKYVVMSDGTSELRLLDPVTMKEIRRLQVSDGGQPVTSLNELEYVRGEILANVFQTDYIARISPTTGKVLGWIDLSGLSGVSHGRGVPGEPDVLNGIAYDPDGQRLFVTGKLWPRIYEIKVVGGGSGREK